MSEVPTVPDLEAYNFYKQDWGSYEELYNEFEWEIPEKLNFVTYGIDRWADDTGRVAIFGGGTGQGDCAYTYGQLQRITGKLANYFSDQGISIGDRIGISSPQKPETAMAHLAAWKMGAVTVPVSTRYDAEAMMYRFSDADVKAAIVDKENITAFREIKPELNLDSVLTIGDVKLQSDEADFWSVQETETSEFETVSRKPADDLIVIYTSGTTGKPKGVLHGHRKMIAHLTAFIASHMDFAVNDDDVVWTPAEWSWTASIIATLGPALYLGLPVVAHYEPEALDAESTFEIIERYNVSSSFIPANMVREMMQVDDANERYDLDSMRIITSGGESLGSDVADWIDDTFSGASIHEVYGQTEVSGVIDEITELFPRREGAFGKPVPGYDVRILDPDKAEPTVETGDVGEIGIRYEGNPACFKRYLNKPEETAKTVQNGWLLTGDLGRKDEDGYVYFFSRKDDVIITSGNIVSPDDVEDSISTHPAVLDTAIIGIPDDDKGERVKAFVELTANSEPTEGLKEEIEAAVSTEMDDYSAPSEIEYIDELPRTVTGKVRRVDLRKRST